MRAQPVIDCETGEVKYVDRGPAAKRPRLATPPRPGATPVGRLLAVKQELVAKDAVVVRERALRASLEEELVAPPPRDSAPRRLFLGPKRNSDVLYSLYRFTIQNIYLGDSLYKIWGPF